MKPTHTTPVVSKIDSRLEQYTSAIEVSLLQLQDVLGSSGWLLARPQKMYLRLQAQARVNLEVTQNHGLLS